jgi:hypothetical protein
LSWPENEVNRIMEITAQQYGGFEAERGGSQSWETTFRLAEQDIKKGTMSWEKILNWPRGLAASPRQTAAADMLIHAHIRSMEPIIAKAADGSKDAQARLLIMHGELSQGWANVGRIQSETARAQNILKARSRYDTDWIKAVPAIIEAGGGAAKAEELAAAMAGFTSPLETQDFLKALASEPTLWDKMFEVWINVGLLSGLATQTTNALSNESVTWIHALETLMAAGIGKLAGSKDRAYAQEALEQVYGQLQSQGEALRMAGRVWMTEKGTGGQKLREGSIKGKLGWWVRTSGRTLMASDAYYKARAYRSKTNALAYRIATNEGLTGEAKRFRLLALRANPTADMIEEAAKHAENVTFTDPLGVKGKAVADVFNKIPVLRIIQPFLNIGMKLLWYAAERTPLALMSSDVRQLLKAGGADAHMAVAKMALGSMVFGSAILLAGAGRITGDGPDDPREKAKWRKKGWAPRSFKVGDEWVSYARLDPWATILGIAATIVEAGDDLSAGDTDGLVTKILVSMSKNMSSKTWMSGMVNFIEALSDPDRSAKRWIAGLAGSLVPVGLAQFTRVYDPKVRETRGADTLEQIQNTLKARIPGLSETLPPMHDIGGDEIIREGGVGPDILSSLRTEKVKNDPIASELIRLRIPYGRPGREIAGHNLTSEQYADYQKHTGKAVWRLLEGLMGRNSYAGMGDEQKQRSVKRAVDYGRRFARMSMKKKYPKLRRPKRLEHKVRGSEAVAPDNRRAWR